MSSRSPRQSSRETANFPFASGTSRSRSCAATRIHPTSARFRTSTEAPERCVLLSVSMKGGRNVVEMGEEVGRCLQDLRARTLPPDLELTRVNDLPRQVGVLVTDFVGNLAQSVLIVLLVAFLLSISVGVYAQNDENPDFSLVEYKSGKKHSFKDILTARVNVMIVTSTTCVPEGEKPAVGPSMIL